MQLSSDERSIISYFSSSTKAQKAIEALQQAGYAEVSMRNIVAQEQETADILSAYDPLTSSLVGDMHVADYAYSVIVITDEPGLDQAVQLIEQHGGMV